MTVARLAGVTPAARRSTVRDALAFDLRLLAFGAAFCGLSRLSTPWTGWVAPSVWAYFVSMCGWTALAAALWFAAVSMRLALRRTRARRALPSVTEVASVVWRRRGGRVHALSALIAAVALTFTVTAYTGWKARLPAIVPFYADSFLARLDVLLHGRDPIAWLSPLFAHPALVRAIDWCYYAGWGVVCLLAAGFAACAPRSRARARVLVYTHAVFVVFGVVLAYAVSSAGPWFVGILTPETNGAAGYIPALRALGGSNPLLVQRAADYLIAQGRIGVGVGAGISAFPSMHVALIAAAAIGARALRVEPLVWVAGALVPVTVVGSVLLGMHYAVDSYASIVGVWLLWYLCGPRVSSRTVSRRPLSAA